MKELKDIILKKGDVVYFKNGTTKEVIYSVNGKASKYSDIIKIERPKYKTIYEAPKEILDKEENRWLENFLKPFRARVKYIEKIKIGFYCPTKEFLSEYIYICLGECKDSISLPRFNRGTMYKGMELDKKYTLKELGLFEGVNKKYESICNKK